MRLFVRFGFIVTGFAAVTTAGAMAEQTVPAIPTKVTAERVLAGSEMFNGRSCVLCHAVGGRGEGASAPGLADPQWAHGDGGFDAIRRVIIWGVEADEMQTPREFEMFPRGGVGLSDEEVEAVAAYVWSLSRPQTNAFVASQGQFIDLARAGNAAEAVSLFRRQLAASPDHPLLPERGLNRLGQSLVEGQPQAALALFQLNAELHPQSGPAFAGMGDAYRALGDRAHAAESYRRVLAINPANEAVQRKLRELEQ